MTTIAPQMTRAEMASRRADLDDKIFRLEQERDMLNQQIREACTLGNNDAGDFTIHLRANRRLDAARIAERFPVAQYPHLYKPVINTPAVRENFSPIELKQFEVEAAPTVLVK